jgi:hypothetical protein
MEAFKNTSMMIILAGIFYGAYQMFVSEPPNWRKEGSAAPEMLMSADDPALQSAAGQLNGPPAMLGPSASTSGAAALSAGPAAGHQTGLANQPALPPTPGPTLPSNLIATPSPSLPTGSLPSQTLPSQTLPSQTLPSQTLPSEFAATNSQPIAGWDSSGTAAVAPAGFESPVSNGGMSPASPTVPPQPWGATPMDRQNLPAASARTGPGPTAGLVADPNLLPIQSNQAPAVDPGMELTQGLRMAMETAGVDIQNGDWTKALRELSAWYQQPLAVEDREQLVEWLDRLAGEVIYSNKHTLAVGHVVGAGETLSSIAARYQMPSRLLARINQFPETVADETPLQPGAELKVVPGPFAAEARLSSGYLTMFAGGLYAGRFRFVIGDSAPDELIEEPISFVSTQGIPAQEEQQRHEPLAATNPFGRFCLVVGQIAVLHSPGGNPNGSCLQFSEQDMQDLLILLPRGTTVRIVQ